MGFLIYQNYQDPTVVRSIKQDTARVTHSLSMEIENPLGSSQFTCSMVDEFDDQGERFKPKWGQRIRWSSDDGNNIVFFDGFITSNQNKSLGFNDLGAEILTYDLTAKDPSWLWEKRLNPAGTFTFDTMTPGARIVHLAMDCDNRFSAADDNDAGNSVGELEVGASTYKETIETIAKTSGLMVWVDTNWKVHTKKWSTILGLGQESKFDINDDSKLYRDLNLQPDDDRVCTRIHVIGSKMDAGTINPQNRKAGRQKSENIVVIKTATLDQINFIRNRIGYNDLPEGTDVDALASNQPGIFESKIECNDIYDETTLGLIGQVYLERYAVPLLSGSVVFLEPGLIPGRSLLLDSDNRQEEAFLPVIELEITSSGGGFNTAGNKVYKYLANFNGPSDLTKLARELEPPRDQYLKTSAKIKPNPPTINNVKTEELILSGGVLRKNYNF